MNSMSDLYKPVEALQRQRKVRLIRQDVREPDEITATLLKGESYTIERIGMPVGAWGWDLREESWLYKAGYFGLAVERKTLADLRDIERTTNQLSRARDLVATLFIVLIEYTFDKDRQRRWSDEAVRHAKLSIQLGGLKVVECGQNEVAVAIDGLFKWSQKLGHSLAGTAT